MIAVRGVSAYYGGVAALRDVDLEVGGGEIVLLLGANGAGKSTLLRSILGILPYQGAIRVAGFDPAANGPAARARTGVHAAGGRPPRRHDSGGDRGVSTRRFAVQAGRAAVSLWSPRGFARSPARASANCREAWSSECVSRSPSCQRRPSCCSTSPRPASTRKAGASWSERLRGLGDRGKAILVATHAQHQLRDIADRTVTLDGGAVCAEAALGNRTRAAGEGEPLRTDPREPQRDGPTHPEADGHGRPARTRGPSAPRHLSTRPLAPIRHIVGKQLRDALHERWLISYAVLLGALGLVASAVGLGSSAGLGLPMFGRTTATLTNLCLMLAPLVALSLGAGALSGERDRGTLENLLAQPLAPHQLLLGKYIGLLASLVIASFAGFLPAALVVARYSGAPALAHYLLFPTLSVLLAAAMLGVGSLLSVRSRGAAQAQGRAIFVWFLFVVVYDLLLMGTLVTSGLGSTALALLLVLNPVDAARVLAVLALEPDLYLLGPAGAFLFGELSRVGTAAVLLGSLLAWAILPLGLAARPLPAAAAVVPRPGRPGQPAPGPGGSAHRRAGLPHSTKAMETS